MRVLRDERGPSDSIVRQSQSLRLLQKCCQHGMDGFIDAARFNLMMPVLVRCLEAAPGPASASRDAYCAHMNEHVVPAVWRLAAAAGTDALWKPLQYQALMLTRSPRPVRRIRRGGRVHKSLSPLPGADVRSQVRPALNVAVC